VPVINGLTNEYHPCQILADVYTFIEHRGLDPRPHRGLDRRLQQHAVHLAAGGRTARLQVHVSSPRLQGRPGAGRQFGSAPEATSPTRLEAVRGADLVTTDVWTSMGFEAENDERAQGIRRLLRRRRT
jgi:ornithine carbamoyltransferase